MIKNRKQFEERLNKLKKDIYLDLMYLPYVKGYEKAIDDVIKLIQDEGGCFIE